VSGRKRVRVPSSHLRSPSLRVLMRRLRTRLPLHAPVRLIQRRGVRFGSGFCLALAVYRQPWRRGHALRPVSYNIVIDSRLSHGEKWECVVHEYAHCLDRDTRHKRPREVHDARWGICFAKTFRASLK